MLQKVGHTIMAVLVSAAAWGELPPFPPDSEQLMQTSSVSAAEVGASLRITGGSMTIGKPDYSSTYYVGVRANISSANAISEVSVSHTPVFGGSFGTWALEPLASYWWNWAPSRVPQLNGPLDGVFTITVVDALDVVDRMELRIWPEVELAFPIMEVRQRPFGFKADAADVPNADYYDLWLWDPIDRFYPSSQRVENLEDLQEISYEGLVDDRTYNLYLLANNTFENGATDMYGNPLLSTFRSYTLQGVTYVPIAPPEELLEALRIASESQGPGKVLSRQVETAIAYHAAEDLVSTCLALADFVSTVQHHAAKPKLEMETAYQLVHDAEFIEEYLLCR